MTPHRLSVEDLQVSSFTTAPTSTTREVPSLNTMDAKCFTNPTAMTWCYICPPEPLFTEEQQPY
jgi:hypothetical protein